jgi:hypothetical protein
MKRGYIIILSGAILLVAGIALSAVWGISFAGNFLRENTIVAKTSIDPGKAIDTKTEVDRLDRSISLAISIDDRSTAEQQGQKLQTLSDIRLKETVTDPTGKVVNSNEFTDAFFTTFKPQVSGVYTVTVSNLGTKPVSISAVFGYMSFVGPDGKPNISAIDGEGIGLVIAGGGLAATGVILLIVGAIIAAIDSRSGNRGNTTATTSENGITYRKD